MQRTNVYWYHPDHLGSSSFVTGLDGEVNQNIEYFPSGVVFVENHLNSYNVPYKFNSKELDGETGNYYYGAKYYNPRVSLWLGVDPAFEEYPSLSPYAYCANNPVRYIDPDGRFLIDVHRRIVQNAFKQFTFNIMASVDIQAFERSIVGSGLSPYRGSLVAPDVRALPRYIGGGVKPSIDSQHFDNMNYSQVINNFSSINSGINSLVSQYKKGSLNAAGLGEGVGEYYHAIADFYSHSNYIELYESSYGQTSVSKIPTISEALSNKKYILSYFIHFFCFHNILLFTNY